MRLHVFVCVESHICSELTRQKKEIRKENAMPEVTITVPVRENCINNENRAKSTKIDWDAQVSFRWFTNP